MTHPFGERWGLCSWLRKPFSYAVPAAAEKTRFSSGVLLAAGKARSCASLWLWLGSLPRATSWSWASLSHLLAISGKTLDEFVV